VLILVALAVVVATVPLTGGRITRLATRRFRGVALLVASFVLQLLVVSVLPGSLHTLSAVLHVASYALAAAFLAVNRWVVGLVVIAIGGALNAVAIAANGGEMPASRSAVASAGLRLSRAHFDNSGLVAHPRFGILGDVFAVPRWLPAHNVFSVGDVVILLGVGYLVHRECRAPSGAPE